MEERAIGARGAISIQNILIRSGPNAVAEIQQKYGLHAQNTAPAIQFLNLFGVSNYQCNQSVVQLLVSRLLILVDISPPDKLLALLPGCIECLHVEELKRVPVAILLKLQPNIPPAILLQLGTNPETLGKLPVTLQRLVWEVSPLIFQNKLHMLLGRPEKDEMIRELLPLIGDSEKVYAMVLAYFRQQFTLSGSASWCTLRMGLLMALHAINWPQLDVRDPCRQFAWFLDTGAAAKFEERLIEKLRNFVFSVPAESPIFGDMAMIAASPSVKKALLDSIMGGVLEVVKQHTTPISHPNLTFLTQLLIMGLTARKILKQQNFNVPRMPEEVLRGFFPLLCADALVGEMEDDEPLHSSILQYLNSLVCREIMHFYVLQNLSAQQTGPLTRLCACVLLTETATLLQRADFIEFLSQTAQGLVALKLGMDQCPNLQIVLDVISALAEASTQVHVIGVQLVTAVSTPLPSILSDFLEILWQRGHMGDTGFSEPLREAYSKLGRPLPDRKEDSTKIHIQFRKDP